MIGDDIEVTVVSINGDKVRLGISAPKEIAVHRKEVYLAIKQENRFAAEGRPIDAADGVKAQPPRSAATQFGTCIHCGSDKHFAVACPHNPDPYVPRRGA